jgi:hemoglobin/transferrin/lactoferrin receptor protein
MKSFVAVLTALGFSLLGYGQTDTISGEANVVIAANKWEQKLNEVPNKITKITQRDIAFNNPQTSADMLLQTGAVFVQKSQLAGGSPMIRGFATNRVLLVIDGVRMNNAIYRSGNLQNVISIDPLATQSAEVIFGPGSTIYGSDAIGGVMDFHSLSARLNPADATKKLKINGNAMARYSSANAEQTYHADVSVGGKKFAWMGSITYSNFDDLVMGKNGGQDSYLRTEFVQRINNRDSILQNSNTRKQVFSGFKQTNVVQKLLYKPTEGLELQYSFFYGGTGTAARYDRLIEYQNGALRFAEWNYGPMLWRMHHLKANLLKANALFDEARIIVGYQNYEESRIDRQRNHVNRRTQKENVAAWSANFDANKKLGNGELFYGIEWVSNRVNSTGGHENIQTGNLSDAASRYPNGSAWSSLGAYALYKWNLHQNWTLNGGLRYTYGEADATFDKTYVPFPFDQAKVEDGALTPTFGMVFRPAKDWQINGNISTGFRIPNIDDLGKLFESNPGNVIVPNPNLESEYAWNFELGTAYRNNQKFLFEINGFYTRLQNAIVRRPTTFSGQDSILFDGVKSQVESLQNIGLLTVYGIQLMAEVWVNNSTSIYTMANLIDGEESDDLSNEQVALRHAPPFYGTSGIRFRKNKFQAEFFSQYNSELSNANLAQSEQAKTTIYAKDKNGKPYSPGWYTINLRSGYTWNRISLNIAWENISNQRYRTYSSGIVAAGSNLIVSVRAGF